MECKDKSWRPRKMLASISRCITHLATLLRRVRVRKTPRSLQICETLSLGDRRVLLVVQVERRRLLIGATNQSIALLDRLDEQSPGAIRSGDVFRLDRSWRGI